MTTFQIEKEVENVRFVLKKRGIDHVVRAHVGVNLDVSGSMQALYRQQVVQRVVERLLPLGLACDVDGAIDIWGFSDRAAFACAASRHNYVGIVEQEMLDGDLDHVLWQGTKYAPAIRANLDFYGLLTPSGQRGGFFGRLFGWVKESSPQADLPVINYFVSDGENSDEAAAWNLLERIEAADAQIYYLCIGIGNQQYQFLKRAAERFPFVGFLAVSDLEAFMKQESVYEELIPSELCEWLKHGHAEDEDH